MTGKPKKSKHENSEAALTMEHIAAIAGVSTITVSRALRDSPLDSVAQTAAGGVGGATQGFQLRRGRQ